MSVTQDATTPGTHSSLDQVDAPSALVAVRGDLRTAKYFIPGHVRCKMGNPAMIAKAWCFALEGFRSRAIPGATERALVALHPWSVGWPARRSYFAFEERRESSLSYASRVSPMEFSCVGSFRIRCSRAIGLVIPDGFHERTLNDGIGFALSLQTQALVHSYLRLS